jgi:hypothetical protein
MISHSRLPFPAAPSIMAYGNHSSGVRTLWKSRTFDPRRDEFRAYYDGHST